MDGRNLMDEAHEFLRDPRVFAHPADQREEGEEDVSEDDEAMMMEAREAEGDEMDEGGDVEDEADDDEDDDEEEGDEDDEESVESGDDDDDALDVGMFAHPSAFGGLSFAPMRQFAGPMFGQPEPRGLAFDQLQDDLQADRRDFGPMPRSFGFGQQHRLDINDEGMEAAESDEAPEDRRDDLLDQRFSFSSPDFSRMQFPTVGQGDERILAFDRDHRGQGPRISHPRPMPREPMPSSKPMPMDPKEEKSPELESPHVQKPIQKPMPKQEKPAMSAEKPVRTVDPRFTIRMIEREPRDDFGFHW